MALDRAAHRPLYAQLHDELRAMIEEGSVLPGERLPTETELAARYGVNRLTVRQSIAELAREGFVAVRQGRGTHVVPRPDPIEVDMTQGAWLVEHDRSAAAASAAGISMREDLLGVMAVPDLGGEPAAQLGTTTALEVESLMLFDDLPAVRTRYWMSPDRNPEEVSEALAGGVSVRVLTELLGTMYYAWRAFDAIAATHRDADVLGVSFGSPLLVRTGLNVDADGHPMLYLQRNAPSRRMRVLIRGVERTVI